MRTESDPALRRRKAALAGLVADADAAVELCGDPEPSVRSAALGALARLGALPERNLVQAMADPEAEVRRKATAIAARLGHLFQRSRGPGAIVASLTRTLSDPDTLVAESAAWALGEWGAAAGPQAVDALARMALGHPEALCRESAVAALGAIGAPRSLEVILEALGDKPAVRRRAVIALSAFDDPRAEEGLRQVLEDRDWQVRQAAEDLLEEAVSED